MSTKLNKNHKRVVRHHRVRKKIVGTTARPRLNVFKSIKAIYVQLIDDSKGHTLTASSTLDKNLDAKQKGTAVAFELGKLIAKQAKELGVEEIVFDRGGYIYHGKIRAVAEGAREGGLKF